MKKIMLCLLLCIIPVSYGADDVYHFSTGEQQSRFHSLTSQLRCLVCQNQNLAESNASLANDLREQIYQQILHQKNDQQIIDYMVARYGDFILYNPPLNYATLGLWFGPLLFLVFGLGYLLFYLQKHSQRESHL